MPIRLAEAFRLVPVNRRTWVPPSWEGIPGERFSALGQVCHVRDIEIHGYQIRFSRMLDESVPSLVSLDSYELAKRRDYDATNSEEEIEAFSVARARTVELLESIEESQF